MSFLSTRKIIIVGATGSGKSSLGNTLLRKDAFLTGNGFLAETNICKLDERDCRFVVDTPGLLDTNRHVNIAQKALKVTEALELLSNTHAFLFVVRYDRFFEDALLVTSLLRITFGQKAIEYGIIVVTHVPSNIPDAEFQMRLKENKTIRDIMEPFSKRIARIDNKNPDVEHVSKIIKLVNVVSCRGTKPFENKNIDCLKEVLLHEAQRNVSELGLINEQLENISIRISEAIENEDTMVAGEEKSGIKEMETKEETDLLQTELFEEVFRETKSKVEDIERKKAEMKTREEWRKIAIF